MFDLNAALQIATLLLLPVLGYLVYLFKVGAEAAVKTSAEEAARAAIQELKWPGELARELQKTRGIERQEIRYQSYGKLWQELRPLAIYDITTIDKKLASDLSSKLSNWYFSDSGGLLLTPQARDFYFALQDLLRATSRSAEEWVVKRPEVSGEERRIFEGVLREAKADQAIAALNFISTGCLAQWQDKAADAAKQWRAGIKAVAARWKDLNELQRFATLQQVGSKLRTALTNDLESRLL